MFTRIALAIAPVMPSIALAGLLGEAVVGYGWLEAGGVVSRHRPADPGELRTSSLT